MSCERLLNVYRNHSKFDDVGHTVELLREVISSWPASGEGRPDLACLEEAWELGNRRVQEQVALPQNVAECLEVPIIDGGIDPFAGLRPEVVDSHLLTSRSKVSFALRSRLREPLSLFRDVKAGSLGALVRGVALGLRWDQVVPYLEKPMSSLAADPSTSSADLLLAYRFASAIVADRVSASDQAPEVQQSVADLRAIMDGIVRCLEGKLSEGADPEARRVVRVIELERVIQAIVDLLTKSGAELEVSMRGIEAILGGKQGPVSHLREYLARGNPLNELVGHAQQADVRRDLERIMEPISEAQLPGFPSRQATSRRASQLLRRLRFLARAMMLRAADPSAAPVFRNFRDALFHGADHDCQLAAARIAFERPALGSESKRARSIRSDLQNLAVKSGFEGCSAAEVREHPFVRAIGGALMIELDTWSLASDGDSTALIDAGMGVLSDAEMTVSGLDEDELRQRVLRGELLAAMKRVVSDPKRPKERGQRLEALLRHGLQRDAQMTPESEAVEEGLEAFKRLIRANFSREFDRAALQRIVDNTIFEDESDEVAQACLAWLESWAFLGRQKGEDECFVDARDSLGVSVTAGTLQSDALANPGRLDKYSGGSSLFCLADAAADGHEAAKTALHGLLTGEGDGRGAARRLIQSCAFDKVGRSVGMVLAQSVSSHVLDRLFGNAQQFELDFAPSVDGVTPTMAAVRFGDGGRDSVEQRQRIIQVLKYDRNHHGRDPRDARGWRAVHHAFAAGNLVAVELLLERDVACLRLQPGDQTTFLIEAIRCRTPRRDPSEVFLRAIDLLFKLEPRHQVEILKFVGPKGISGRPLSLVSAALDHEGARWPMLVTALEDAVRRESILSAVGPQEVRALLEAPDESRFSLFCQQFGQVTQGNERLVELLSKVDPSAAMVVLAQVGDAESAVSARGKCGTLRGLGALDLAKVDPATRENALHRLAKSVGEPSGTAGADDFAAKLYNLAWDVLRLDSSTQRQAELVSALDLDGETPIGVASRLGLPSLALAYAQFLGHLSGTSEERWLEAARLIKDPMRYQDGIPESRRVAVNGNRQLVLGAGAKEPKILAKRPLPADLNSRSAREWLVDNAMEIAGSLRELFGLSAHIPMHAFVNWLAHLSSERATSPSASR
jgi:hypothetical protein